MAFTKLFLSVRLLCIEANFARTVLRSYSGTLEAPACNKNEEKPKTDKTSASGPPSRKGVVLGVYEEGEKFSLTPAAEEINQKSGGKLCKHLNELSCELRLGKSFVVTDVVADGDSVALASLGPRDPPHDPQEGLDEGKENVRVGVGAGVSCLRSRGVIDIAVDVAGHPRAAAEAAHLAAWTFQEFKSTVGRKSEVRLSALGGDRGEWSSGVVLGESQNWARYLCDMPANVMTPAGLAQEALDVLCPLGVQVLVRERKWAEAQRMETFLSVARGSCEPPLLLECHYRPEADAHGPPVLLAATGVTFDSGGLCLKSRTQMSEGRGCMSGAAVVLAALRALALAKAAINVSAIIPLCENMVSGQCLKVGDVVTVLNGTRVQIEDTDMEGRLLLADALVYGQTLLKPALVLDVAALTQGVALATGGGAFGCFSNSDSAWSGLRGAGAETGDRPWRLPLWAYYGRDIQADPAVDLKNRGSCPASPCVGAAFLKNFVCADWMHLDITGVSKLAHARAPPYLDPLRMTGRPTRTLATFLTNTAGSSGKLGNETFK